EIHRAAAPFAAEGRSFAAGDHVVLMQQPFSGFAKQLLERQRYPDLRIYPGGPPVRPYDVTAHTLPLLMGVDAVAVPSPLPAGHARGRGPAVRPDGSEGRGRFFALGHKNGALVALGGLLRARVPVSWATTAFGDAGRRFEAGTLLVPAAARARLLPLVRELGLVAQGIEAAPPPLRLRTPRVGRHHSSAASTDAA